MRLALGSGAKTSDYKLRGFMTVDASDKFGPDYVAEIPPLPDGIRQMGRAFDVVEGMHFWEHLYLWQAEELAEQIYQILKPKGKLVLELPNLEKAMLNMLTRNADPRLGMWAIYGAQNDPKWHNNPFCAHRWGYTPYSLTQQLKQAGFEKVEAMKATTRLPIVRDMRIEATRV